MANKSKLAALGFTAIALTSLIGGVTIAHSETLPTHTIVEPCVLWAGQQAPKVPANTNPNRCSFPGGYSTSDGKTHYNH